MLPGGSELRPLSGTVKGDDVSRWWSTRSKAGSAAARAGGSIEARQTAGGLALYTPPCDAPAAVDGTASHYRALAMPAGRTSLQMTLASQGRSASALTGAISGQRHRD